MDNKTADACFWLIGFHRYGVIRRDKNLNTVYVQSLQQVTGIVNSNGRSYILFDIVKIVFLKMYSFHFLLSFMHPTKLSKVRKYYLQKEQHHTALLETIHPKPLFPYSIWHLPKTVHRHTRHLQEVSWSCLLFLPINNQLYVLYIIIKSDTFSL